MDQFTYVCNLNELKKNMGKVFTINGKKCAVFYNGENAFVTSPFCPHARANLTQGKFEGETVTCHWHGWSFDLKTGKGENNDSSLKLYPSKIENNQVFACFEKPKETFPDLDPFPEIKWKK